MSQIESVAAMRAQLWDAGFRPVSVITNDKQPIGNDWVEKARQDPPPAVVFTPVAHALNTGILCNGLRAIDIDIDDKEVATRCRSLVVQRFGEAPIRMRRNSARCLILYRAAVGEPRKLVLKGEFGKIEALGKGQQFVAFGGHPSGATLEWFPHPPGSEPISALPAISESDLLELFSELAPIIRASKIPDADTSDRQSGEPEADPLRIATALNAIPNNGPSDWEAWNRVGMAVWRATGGSQIGWHAFDAWSQRHPSYDHHETRSRWEHYFTSPPTQIGAGSLFHMAEQSKEEEKKPEQQPTFAASPLDWDAMLAVQPREWVYGHFLIKRFISVLGAPGGTGKTAYAFGIALSVATGRELLNEPVHEPGNVWIYNLEDPKDELLRRFRAACEHYAIEKTEILGRIFLDSGRDRPLVIAESTRDGGIIVSPVVPLLIAELKARDIRVLIVDPFVRSHRLEENANDQMDAAAAEWGRVADQANCSIFLVHHFRKGGASGDAAAFRGASAVIDAARAALSQATMSEKEAQRFGIDDNERWQYVRVDNAKLNLAPPPEATTWLRLVSVDIGNGKNGRASDKVQAVERWEPPSAWDGMPWSMVLRILDKIDAGPGGDEYYALGKQAKGRWAGQVIMDDACKTEEQAKAILKSWKDSGVLEEGQYVSPSAKGRLAGCVRTNPAKVAEMRQQLSGQDGADE